METRSRLVNDMVTKLTALAVILFTGVGLIVTAAYLPTVAEVALFTGACAVLGSILMAIIICSIDV